MFSYQTWFAVRYVHIVSAAVLSGGALSICTLISRPAAALDPRTTLAAAAVYERAFWALAGVIVATGVSNLGLKEGGLLGPQTGWGMALSLKLTLALLLLLLSVVRSDFVARTPPPTPRARAALFVLYGGTAAVMFAALWIGLGLAHGRY
jgi:hypothetical protein